MLVIYGFLSNVIELRAMKIIRRKKVRNLRLKSSFSRQIKRVKIK